MDYAVNQDLDIFMNEYGRFETVSGREEFEQDFVKAITGNESDYFGLNISDAALEQKLRNTMATKAREAGLSGQIESFEIERTPGVETGVTVYITYVTGQTFSESL